jgi:hypothetical protein
MLDNNDWNSHVKSICNLADRMERYGEQNEAEILRKCASELEICSIRSVTTLKRNKLYAGNTIY